MEGGKEKENPAASRSQTRERVIMRSLIRHVDVC